MGSLILDAIKMKKITIILCFAFALQGQAQQLENSKPNIIIIMPDDISFGQHSYFDGFYNTPQIDKLFNMGKELTNFHTSPTCAPTRAALMSGRHEFYSGITHTILMRDQMNLKQTILPENLKKAGYTTAMYGKWHLGDGKEYRPLQRGFDEVLQHGAGGIGQNYDHSADFPANLYNNPTLLHNEEIIETEGYCTDIFFDAAIQWIDKVRTKKKPFFIYLSLNVAHNPQQHPTG
jgi:arylsulfatase